MFVYIINYLDVGWEDHAPHPFHFGLFFLFQFKFIQNETRKKMRFKLSRILTSSKKDKRCLFMSRFSTITQ